MCACRDNFLFKEEFTTITQWLQDTKETSPIRTISILHKACNFTFRKCRIHRDHQGDNEYNRHQY